MDAPLDCLVIGAGPAGLTAAIYLARFRLDIAVVDGGQSRAATIPRTNNHAGYPDGIPGAELVQRMRDQAARFGVEPVDGEIDRLERVGGEFVVHAGARSWRTRTVLLATGVVNNRPPIDPRTHDVAVARGLLRYCPICDGYEVTDLNVGVIGTQTHGFNEAVFLRMYTPQVTLIAPDGEHALSDDERARLADLNVHVVDGACEPLTIDEEAIYVTTPSGVLAFDSIYPAMGSIIKSELAVTLGAQASEEGCLVTDGHQRTTIPGLYAAGDIAKGLDQISHAMGEAGVAATTIRNDLAQAAPLMREERRGSRLSVPA
jgi:thioredoxin reductase (NADPH)